MLEQHPPPLPQSSDSRGGDAGTIGQSVCRLDVRYSEWCAAFHIFWHLLLEDEGLRSEGEETEKKGLVLVDESARVLESNNSKMNENYCQHDRNNIQFVHAKKNATDKSQTEHSDENSNQSVTLC